MNVPIWLLTIAPLVAGLFGFLLCAMCMVSGSADEQFSRWEAEAERDDAKKAHARCADSRNVLLSRIDRLKSIAASQQSVKSGRIVAVLEGGE